MGAGGNGVSDTGGAGSSSVADGLDEDSVADGLTELVEVTELLGDAVGLPDVDALGVGEVVGVLDSDADLLGVAVGVTGRSRSDADATSAPWAGWLQLTRHGYMLQARMSPSVSNRYAPPP